MKHSLVIACGALAHEIVALKTLNGWQHLKIQCLPADYHNRPEKITPAVQALIVELRDKFDSIFVAYGDCGSGGQLDAMLASYNIERLPGDHCYAFYAGAEAFNELSEQALGSFYVTDFLLQHFDRLIVQGLGLDQHPELKDIYFANYQRLVYLAQTPVNADQRKKAQIAAAKLGLAFHEHFTGYGGLKQGIANHLKKHFIPLKVWQN